MHRRDELLAGKRQQGFGESVAISGGKGAGVGVDGEGK